MGVGNNPPTVSVSSPVAANNYFFPTASAPLGALRKAAVDQMSVALDYSSWLAAGDTIASVKYTLRPGSNPMLIVYNSGIGLNTATLPIKALVSFYLGGGLAGLKYALDIVVNTLKGAVKTDTLYITLDDTAPSISSPSFYSRPSPGGYPLIPANLATNPPSPVMNVANIFSGDPTEFASSYVRFTASKNAPQAANVLDFWFDMTDGSIYQCITDGVSAFWVSTTGAQQHTPQYIVSLTDPGITNFTVGDFWYDKTNSLLKMVVNNGVTNIWLTIG